jgi:tripartite-type tricarboxylate transporter receptor subunit TctC
VQLALARCIVIALQSRPDDNIEKGRRRNAMRRVIGCLFALPLTLYSIGQQALAQTYPAHPARIIVPFSAAGPTDVIARIIAQKLSDAWGQQVYTENFPGAGGNTGIVLAAKAAPDGYNMLAVSTGFIINPSLYAKVPYDPIGDFSAVTLVAASPNVISTHPSVPATTLQELIALIKSHPGKYSFAQPATGSTPHLVGELLKLKFGLDLVTVPFTGAGLAINSTLGGHTPIAITALPPAMATIREGKLRGIAVLSTKRSGSLPDVLTNIEAGVPDLESDTLTGIVAPAGTPKEIIDMWQQEIAKTVMLPEIKERLEALGFVPVANSPEEFARRLKTEMAKWGQIVRDAHIRVE